MSDAENQQGMARRDFIKQTAAAGAIVFTSNAFANVAHASEAQEGGQADIQRLWSRS